MWGYTAQVSKWAKSGKWEVEDAIIVLLEWVKEVLTLERQGEGGQMDALVFFQFYSKLCISVACQIFNCYSLWINRHFD